MRRKLHPANAICLLFLLMTGALLIKNPFYAMILLGALVFSIASSREQGELKNLVKFWIPTGLMVLIINPLVSTQGSTVLFRTVLPVIGRIRITAESIAYGGAMVLRLFSMVLVIKLFGLAIDRDDFFGFLSRRMNKLVLTMSMTVNMIHRLRLEINRVREVMVSRGLDLKSGGFIRRIKAHYPLIKVVLISSLEGSINRAEALHSRGYGKGGRSFYGETAMTKRDWVHAAAQLLYLAVLIAGVAKGQLSFKYFPSLGKTGDFNILYMAMHLSSLTFLILETRRCTAWKYSI